MTSRDTESDAHLDDETVRRFRDRTLAPEALVAAGRHVQACEACRGRIQPAAVTEAAVRSLQHGLAYGDAPHLDFDAMVAYAEGTSDRFADAAVERHLADCASCTREVDDLIAFRASRQPQRRRMWWAAAAAVLFVVATAVAIALSVSRPGGVHLVWRERTAPAPQRQARPAPPPQPEPQFTAAVRDGGHVVGIDRDGTLHGTSVEGRWAALVIAALQNPELTRAAVADAAPVQLRGESEATPIEIVQPVATVVDSARPTFRWKSALKGAKYDVAVFDNDLRPVTRGSAKSASWTATADLACGRTYVWQVRATVADDEFVAPPPDQPQARFSTLPCDAAQALAAARARGEGHLVVGVILHSAGATDAAHREFTALAAENPGSRVAKQLAQSTAG